MKPKPTHKAMCTVCNAESDKDKDLGLQAIAFFYHQKLEHALENVCAEHHRLGWAYGHIMGKYRKATR